MHGEFQDCTQWKENFNDCKRWSESADEEAAKRVIERERARIAERLKVRGYPPEESSRTGDREVANVFAGPKDLLPCHFHFPLARLVLMLHCFCNNYNINTRLASGKWKWQSYRSSEPGNTFSASRSPVCFDSGATVVNS